MSVKVVRRPFKTRGKVYPAGTIIEDPAGIPLYKSKVGEGKIVEVDEHNIERVATYLKYRRGVENAYEILRAALDKAKAAKAEPEAVKPAAKPQATTQAKTVVKPAAPKPAAKPAAAVTKSNPTVK